jgi:hypothetical protein
MSTLENTAQAQAASPGLSEEERRILGESTLSISVPKADAAHGFDKSAVLAQAVSRVRHHARDIETEARERYGGKLPGEGKSWADMSREERAHHLEVKRAQFEVQYVNRVIHDGEAYDVDGDHFINTFRILESHIDQSARIQSERIAELHQKATMGDAEATRQFKATLQYVGKRKETIEGEVLSLLGKFPAGLQDTRMEVHLTGDRNSDEVFRLGDPTMWDKVPPKEMPAEVRKDYANLSEEQIAEKWEELKRENYPHAYWGRLQTQWVSAQLQDPNSPLAQFHSRVASSTVLREKLASREERGIDVSFDQGILQGVVDSEIPVLEEEALASLKNWRENDLPREMEYAALLVAYRDMVKSSPGDERPHFSSLKTLSAHYEQRIADHEQLKIDNPEKALREQSFINEIQKDYAVFKEVTERFSRDSLEDIGYRFSSKSEVPYSYDIALQEWEGTPPRGQLQVDVVTTHYQVLDRLSRLNTLALHRLKEVEKDSAGLEPTDLIARRKAAIDSVFEEYGKIAGEVEGVASGLAKRILDHGAEGIPSLSTKEEREAFAIIVAQKKLEDAPLQAQREANKDRNWNSADDEGFVSIPLSAFTSRGFDMAKTERPERYVIPDVLRGDYTAEQLQESAKTYGQAYANAMEVYRGMERRLASFQGIHDAVSLVGDGSSLEIPLTGVFEMESADGGARSFTPSRVYKERVARHWKKSFDLVGAATSGELGANFKGLAKILEDYRDRNTEHPEFDGQIKARASRFINKYYHLFESPGTGVRGTGPALDSKSNHDLLMPEELTFTDPTDVNPHGLIVSGGAKLPPREIYRDPEVPEEVLRSDGGEEYLRRYEPRPEELPPIVQATDLLVDTVDSVKRYVFSEDDQWKRFENGEGTTTPLNTGERVPFNPNAYKEEGASD